MAVLVIAPRLDRKVCLLKRTEQRDAEGFAYEVWQEVAEMWAGRERITANEQSLAMQTRGAQIDRMRIRYLACLEDESNLGNYRVRFNGRDYNIVSCIEDLRHPRRAWMLITLGFIQGQPTLTSADVPASV